MSRHRKQRHPYGPPAAPVSPAQSAAPSSTPASPATPAPSANGTAPPHDITAELVALSARIEATRRELNARLDALAQAVERLLPTYAPALSSDTHVVPQQPAEAPPPAMPAAPTRVVRVGDNVYVPHLGGTYTVVEVAASGKVFKVQAGTVRVQVRSDEVWALDEKTPERRSRGTPTGASSDRRELSANILEIDLHGYSEADALITLELFLHHAFAQRTPRVRIIHGKGNGTLRAAVRRELARHPLVHTVEMGPQFRGDDGVTLADLDV